ncbi:Shikimate dehydrogenase [Pseudovibrio axinellae]|uniref:Shikimate dehydrogenase (NADP(+)) n=1 Tax=Pseudovibrio axinellae TaxID=989403 RepID=A0A165ZN09_9HYPH|nr:shikimate dehydrogenase [Pseudovibrio axinellae]KZL20076.1 Shikimate dehydrogenase [Pseudovibrio axinellae]SEQ26427.1 shikimate dehydrogenase [Pseudovibrio axinellae]
MRKAAVTGHPIGHSKSPLIHGYWLKQHGIEGSYIAQDVPPEIAENFYRSLPEHGFVGCNVTIPNKEIAYNAATKLDDAAKMIGAVNTLWLDEDGVLNGSNTDGLGFLGNLDQMQPNWDNNGNKAVVLGAGGASRAIIWALLKREYTEVYIANRTLEKAQKLASHFGPKTIAISWDKLGETLGEVDFLVNTTSLGMSGQPELGLNLDNLSKSAVVTDIVYSPLQTNLLHVAEERGNPTVDGLGMLLHQAVPGFEKWFGVRPEVTTELRRIILKEMGLL